jgi:two-component system cell cycle response regulator
MNRKHKILIVDDEPLNVKLLAARIPTEQYETIQAYGGDEALEKVKTEQPDLILLDVMMPRIDGYEVTHRVKTDPASQDIPVILITALDGAENKIKGLEAGADEFLNKPVNTAELLARMRSLISLKEYQDQLKTHAATRNRINNKKGQDRPVEKRVDLPTILLVEDNEKDSKLIHSYLRGEPYQIKLARDGKEALSCAQQKDIDVILLDILLPGIDGFEVCRQLKANEQTKTIQIVAITNLRELENKVRGLKLGADDYLVKPVNIHELQLRVKGLVKKKAYLDSIHAGHETSVYSAITDKLTGLYNYAYFKHFLELEIKRSERHEHPVALVMIDIDDFHELNGSLGDLVGDEIVKHVGNLIKQNTRVIDAAARYRGQEFAVVLPNTDADGALRMAERIKHLIFDKPFLEEKAPLPRKIPISIGVAVYPSDARNSEDLIKNAESALYEAKKVEKTKFAHTKNLVK